jgi:hypothetical protein
VPAAADPRGPSGAVAVGLEVERPGIFQAPAQAALQLRLEPGETTIINGVLHARMFALRAIAKISLDGNDLFRKLDDLFGHTEADHIR